MLSLKVTTVGNSLGVVLPREVLARLGLVKGDLLHVLETPGGIELTPYDPDMARQLEVLQQVVHAERDVLRHLNTPSLAPVQADRPAPAREAASAPALREAPRG